MGLDSNMQLIMSGVLNCVQLVGVIPSLWTMDRFGRRSILLIGSALMFVSHTIIAALVGVYSHDWPSYTTQGWVSVTFLMIYMLSFGASWGPVPWAMPSEVFPSSLRAKGVALSTCSSKLSATQYSLVVQRLTIIQTGSTTSSSVSSPLPSSRTQASEPTSSSPSSACCPSSGSGGWFPRRLAEPWSRWTRSLATVAVRLMWRRRTRSSGRLLMSRRDLLCRLRRDKDTPLLLCYTWQIHRIPKS